MNILAILAILAATALGGGGVVYASGDALPGDALYGVKTSAEDVQLALAGDAQDINLYNQFLAERTMEMSKLIEAERFDDLAGAAVRYEQNLAAMVQTLLNDPLLCDMLMEQIQLAQQERLRTMTQLMEHTPEEAQTNLQQVLRAEAQQLSPGLGEPGFGPGEPGMGAGESESGQGEGKPGQGPGEAGGSEQPQGAGQDGASGQGQGQDQGQSGQTEPGAGEPQGNGEPGMGDNEPAGTAVPGQGEPGFGPGEQGTGDCELDSTDCEPVRTGVPGQGDGQGDDQGDGQSNGGSGSGSGQGGKGN